MVCVIKENNKDQAKIMADLLRSGYTMLNLSCPVCNNPLFRKKQNDIFCPICNKKVIYKKEASTNKKIENKDNLTDRKQDIEKRELSFKFETKLLLNILQKKIDFISKKLEEETQIELIEKYVDLLIKIYDILRKINKYNASAGI